MPFVQRLRCIKYLSIPAKSEFEQALVTLLPGMILECKTMEQLHTLSRVFMNNKKVFIDAAIQILDSEQISKVQKEKLAELILFELAFMDRWTLAAKTYPYSSLENKMKIVEFFLLVSTPYEPGFQESQLPFWTAIYQLMLADKMLPLTSRISAMDKIPFYRSSLWRLNYLGELLEQLSTNDDLYVLAYFFYYNYRGFSGDNKLINKLSANISEDKKGLFIEYFTKLYQEKEGQNPLTFTSARKIIEILKPC